jgi:hypothetical protein
VVVMAHLQVRPRPEGSSDRTPAVMRMSTVRPGVNATRRDPVTRGTCPQEHNRPPKPYAAGQKAGVDLPAIMCEECPVAERRVFLGSP